MLFGILSTSKKDKERALLFFFIDIKKCVQNKDIQKCLFCRYELGVGREREKEKEKKRRKQKRNRFKRIVYGFGILGYHINAKRTSFFRLDWSVVFKVGGNRRIKENERREKSIEQHLIHRNHTKSCLASSKHTQHP